MHRLGIAAQEPNDTDPGWHQATCSCGWTGQKWRGMGREQRAYADAAHHAAQHEGRMP